MNVQRLISARHRRCSGCGLFGLSILLIWRGGRAFARSISSRSFTAGQSLLRRCRHLLQSVPIEPPALASRPDARRVSRRNDQVHPTDRAIMPQRNRSPAGGAMRRSPPAAQVCQRALQTLIRRCCWNRAGAMRRRTSMRLAAQMTWLSHPHRHCH